VNSFEEWQRYTEDSISLEIRIGSISDEIVQTTTKSAVNLAEGQESVDSEIPSALKKFAHTAQARKVPVQDVAVAITSALRSIGNVSVSLVEYVRKIISEGYHSISQNGRAIKLLRATCRFFPEVLRLAASSHIDLRWLLNHADEIRTVCDMLAKGKAQGRRSR
jgi:hypothetical protein